MTKLTLALAGDLRKVLAAQRAEVERGLTNAVRAETLSLKKRLRAQVSRAGFGRRLANTWRSQTFPKGKASLGAAGVVFSKAPKIIRAFSEGVTIRAKRGRFLAVPTPAAPKKGKGGKRLTPRNFPEERLGKLRFVPRRAGLALLVVDNVRASFSRQTGALRGFRKASARALRTGSGLTTAVMFILVPQIKLRKRFNPLREARKSINRLPSRIVANLGRTGT